MPVGDENGYGAVCWVVLAAARLIAQLHTTRSMAAVSMHAFRVG